MHTDRRSKLIDDVVDFVREMAHVVGDVYALADRWAKDAGISIVKDAGKIASSEGGGDTDVLMELEEDSSNQTRKKAAAKGAAKASSAPSKKKAPPLVGKTKKAPDGGGLLVPAPTTYDDLLATAWQEFSIGSRENFVHHLATFVTGQEICAEDLLEITDRVSRSSNLAFNLQNANEAKQGILINISPFRRTCGPQFPPSVESRCLVWGVEFHGHVHPAVS